LSAVTLVFGSLANYTAQLTSATNSLEEAADSVGAMAVTFVAQVGRLFAKNLSRRNCVLFK
jgi:hypothetical protein